MPKINELVEKRCPICGSVKTVKYRGRPLNNPCQSCDQKINGGRHCKHNGDGTRLYKIWVGIRARCNRKSAAYGNYGGRGITVCEEWSNGYVPFRDWALANGYHEALQIDRIDNEGNYAPENCHWTTCKVNSRNRRSTLLDAEKVQAMKHLHRVGYSCKKLAELFGISYGHTWDIVVSHQRWSDVDPDQPQESH